MDWIYNSNNLVDIPEDYLGFVYIIRNKTSGKKYIGKKFFLFSKKKKNKKTSRNIILKVESDWKSYYGSSPSLQKDIEEHGKENFIREILYLCRSRGECTYVETREIFANGALLREDFYNEFVGCKIQSSHIKLLCEEYNVTATHVSNSISE